jgi:SpoIID/LytB domain protein
VLRPLGRLGCALAFGCALLAATAGRVSASSVLVVSGHGWGHGVGMSQWGAYGYALHGWSYRQILTHYYPGTELGRVGEPRVRVLLDEGASVVTVGCAARMSVSDATGRGHPLPAGRYGVGPRLVFPIVRPRAHVRHARGQHTVVQAVGRALRSPVALQCARAPLELDGRLYHGSIVLRAAGGRLSVVNSLPLDTYLRGVVGAEMPSHWSTEALEAQAVAARSYAVATLHPGEPWDLYPDDRSQVYAGIAAEDPRTDAAVLATKGQVLTYAGRVATTYYSSSSGGRTADVRDLLPGAAAVPYLRPVSDPYDAASPHHTWGPLAFSGERLGARLGLAGAVASVRVERSNSGRVAALDLGLASGAVKRLTGKEVEEALHLRSTWFDVGTLSLSANRGRLLFGRGFVLDASASVAGAKLQGSVAGGPWTTVRSVRAGAKIVVHPNLSARYRLVAPGVSGPTVEVTVAPRVQVRPLGRRALAGTVLPRPAGVVTIWRYGSHGWEVVAHPRLDPEGRFRTPVRVRAGGYRISVAGDGRLASTELRFRVTKEQLASLPGPGGGA